MIDQSQKSIGQVEINSEKSNINQFFQLKKEKMDIKK